MLNIPDLRKTNLKLLINSVKYKGGIVTGGECKVGCRFCYLRESKRIAPCIPLNIPFISKNDFKKAVLAAKKYKHRAVSLGDGVDLISSEPFIHPFIYEFIKKLEASKFIDTIAITTSGAYIKKEKYDFLPESKKIKWAISCSSLFEEGRRNTVIMKNCDRLLDFLYFLHNKNCNSVIAIQLVVYKLKYFIKDIEIIKNNFPKFLSSIYIRILGYNKFFSKESKSVIEHCRNEFKKVLEYCSKNHISINWDDTNLAENFELKYKFSCFRSTLNNFIKKINTALAYSVGKNFKAPILCISASCFFVLPKIRDKIILPKLKKVYLGVKNKTFGGTYSCYGLLALDDFFDALRKINLKNYDSIVLDGIFLNSDQCDLKRTHISELKKRFKLPIIVMDQPTNMPNIY